MTNTTATILRVVCEVYGVPLDALRGPGRARNLSDPRAVAMGLLRRYAGLTLVEIAGALVRKDPSTVSHALDTYAMLLETSLDAQRCAARVKAAFDQPEPVAARVARPGGFAAQSRARRGL